MQLVKKIAWQLNGQAKSEAWFGDFSSHSASALSSWKASLLSLFSFSSNTLLRKAFLSDPRAKLPVSLLSVSCLNISDHNL